MIVKIPTDVQTSTLLRWIESNVGSYGKDWVIYYNKSEANSHLTSKNNDLDIFRTEDAVAYKLRFGV